MYNNNFILKSSGDLENNEQIANLAIKIAYTAAKIPVNPDSKDSFKRISSMKLQINQKNLTLHPKIFLILI